MMHDQNNPAPANESSGSDQQITAMIDLARSTGDEKKLQGRRFAGKSR